MRKLVLGVLVGTYLGTIVVALAALMPGSLLAKNVQFCGSFTFVRSMLLVLPQFLLFRLLFYGCKEGQQKYLDVNCWSGRAGHQGRVGPW